MSVAGEFPFKCGMAVSIDHGLHVKVNLVIAAPFNHSAEMAVRRMAKVVAVDNLPKQANRRPSTLRNESLTSGNWQPSCPENTDAMSYKRRIGYYELFNLDECLCEKVFPENLEVVPLTHINLTFMLFDSMFNMIDNAGDPILSYSELSSRKYSLSTQTYYDPTSTVKYNVYDGNQ